VDFAKAEAGLVELEVRQPGPELCRQLLEQWTDSRLKLWVTHRALRARNEARELFREGDYQAVAVEGDRAEHVVAFARSYQQRTALIAVPRLLFTMLNGEPRVPGKLDWGTTRLRLPPEFASLHLRNPLTGESIALRDNLELLCGEVFADFPVALLIA
jgi:(1->4)-alpha-D-glucan 1-alpha-D-glucosylmutase